MFGKKKKTEKKETSSKNTVTKKSSANTTAAKKPVSTTTRTVATVKTTSSALPETLYIANDAHYDQVIERIKDVKKTLWIGTADIKDLYVKDGRGTRNCQMLWMKN